MKLLSDNLIEINIVISGSGEGNTKTRGSAIVNRFHIKKIWRSHIHRNFIRFMPNTKDTYPLSYLHPEGPAYEIPDYEYEQLIRLGQPVCVCNMIRYRY